MLGDPQQTLTGENATLLTDAEANRITVKYFKSNPTHIMDMAEQTRNECEEDAKEFLQNSGLVEDPSEDTLSSLAENFVSETFDSILENFEKTGFSLWIEMQETPQQSYDIPLYVKSPRGIVISKETSVGEDHSIEASKSFLKGTGEMLLGEDSEGSDTDWSNPNMNRWNEVSDVEKELFHIIRNIFIGMTSMTPEIALVMQKGLYLKHKDNEISLDD